MCLQIIFYMCKQNLALNNPQWLICHKTKPNPPYNGDNYEMLIKIFNSFLNRNINIIMDCCYNKKSFKAGIWILDDNCYMFSC